MIRQVRGHGRALLMSPWLMNDTTALMSAIRQDLAVRSTDSGRPTPPVVDFQSKTGLVLAIKSKNKSLMFEYVRGVFSKELKFTLSKNKTEIMALLEDVLPKPEIIAKLRTVSPVIVSASRHIDIPAFHSDWFFDRLSDGYLPQNQISSGDPMRISFEDTRAIIFWTKKSGSDGQQASGIG